jgi:hypothetical protein
MYNITTIPFYLENNIIDLSIYPEIPDHLTIEDIMREISRQKI